MKPFKRQQYERPLGKYQCGRAACWDKPCFNGPKPDGTCGGATECAPIRKGDHWECMRPASAGGPCSPGPNPDGTCCKTRTPCVPRLTLRAVRGRLTALACIVVIAAIAAWFHFGNPRGPMASVNPGPLSGAHEHVAEVIFAKNGHGGGGDTHNCVLCHRAHDAGAAGWIAAAFKSSKMSDQCLKCHRFGDPADNKIQNREHNEVFAHPSKAPGTECQMCHTEHRGVNASLISITDSQCNTCHTKSVHHFAKDHPAFSASYPQKQFSGIVFDHKKHQERIAGFDCRKCHVVNAGDRNMALASFEQSCKECHQNNIPGADLSLLQLDPANPPFAPFNKLLLGEGSGQDAFYREVSRSGDVIQARLQSMNRSPQFTNLFRGLKWDSVSKATATAINSPGKAVAASIAGDGWYWTAASSDTPAELHYHATAHADPVMKAWLEFSLGVPSEFQSAMLARSGGPGACAKCHVSVPGDAPIVSWAPPPPPAGHTVFSHDPHTKLMDCAGCHVLNDSADISKQFASGVDILQSGATPISNFKPIQLQNCSQCHGERKISSDCRLCHRYHLEHTLEVPSVRPAIRAMNMLAVVPARAMPAQPHSNQLATQSTGTEAADKAAAEKAAADAAAKKAADEKTAAEQEKQKAKLAEEKPKSSDKAAKDKAAKDKVAADKAAKDKAAADAAAKTAADKAAAAQTAEKTAQTTTSTTTASTTTSSSGGAGLARKTLYHGEIVGNEACKDCHGGSYGIWQQTKHNKSWDKLRRDRVKVPKILAAVGDKTQVAKEPLCLNCHATVLAAKPDSPLGVSCESCHGAAGDWRDIHGHDVNDPVKFKKSMDDAAQKGMINPGMPQELVENCLGCHNYDKAEVSGQQIAKMLAADHPAFDFEFVAYSQGSVWHRTTSQDATDKVDAKPDERARWFVIGKAVQIVSSARLIQQDGSEASIKSAQQAKLDDAAKVLNSLDLPEAKSLINAPSEDNLSKFIAACKDKDFTGKVGSSVPTSFK